MLAHLQHHRASTGAMATTYGVAVTRSSCDR